MLRQIEWYLQNGSIIENGVLPVTALFFLKILFQLKNLLRIIDLMYQQPKRPYSYFF